MKKNAPIGFFDSGLGGAAVLADAMQQMPHENFIFFGDNGYAPYGNKSKQEILQRANQIVEFLLEKQVKAIVIACNTATGVAVKELRQKYQLPIISMEPAVKVALNHKNGGKILVMATPATLEQDKYLNLVEKLNVRDKLLSMPCDGLVELIEAGQETAPYLEQLLSQVKDQKIDSVVLGCTHYVYVKPQIERIFQHMGKTPVIVDGSEGTVKHLQTMLGQRNQLKTDGPRTIELFTSGDPAIVLPGIKRAIGEPGNQEITGIEVVL